MLSHSIEVEKLVTELTNKRSKISPDERAQKLDQLFGYLAKFPIKKILENIESTTDVIENLKKIISDQDNLAAILKKYASVGTPATFSSFSNFVKDEGLLKGFNPPLSNWVELIKAHKGRELNFLLEMLIARLQTFNQFKQFLLDHPADLASLLDKANPKYIRELFHDRKFGQAYFAKQDIKKLHEFPNSIFEAFADDPACIGLNEFIVMHRNQDDLIKSIIERLSSRQLDNFLEIVLPHLDDKSPLAIVLNLSVLKKEIVTGFILVQQLEVLEKDHPEQVVDFIKANKDDLHNYVRDLQALHKALISMQSTPYFSNIIEFLRSKNFLDKSVKDVRNALKLMENKIRTMSMALRSLDVSFDPLKSVNVREFSQQLEKEKSQQDAKEKRKPLSAKEIAKIHIEQANISRERKDELIARIDNPSIMDQEQNALCGPTTFIMHLAAIDPVRYADIAIKLLTDKKVSIKNTDGDELILANTYKDAKMEKRSIDMIFLAALRRATNTLGVYASSKAVGSHAEVLMGYTKPDDFVKWFQVFYGNDCPIVNTCQVYVEGQQPAPKWMQDVSGVKANPEHADLAKNLQTAVAEVQSGSSVTMFMTMGLARQIVEANKKPGEIVRYDQSDDSYIPLVRIEMAHYVKINALSFEIDKDGRRLVNVDMDTWTGNHKAKIPYKDFLQGYRGVISAHPKKVSYEDKPIKEDKEEKKRTPSPTLPPISMEDQRADIEVRLGGITAAPAKASSAAPTLPPKSIEEQNALLLARLAGITAKPKATTPSLAPQPSKDDKSPVKQGWKQAAPTAKKREEKAPAPIQPDSGDGKESRKLVRKPAAILPVMPFFSHAPDLTQLYQELAIRGDMLESLKEIEPLLPKLEDGTDYFSARVLPKVSGSTEVKAPESPEVRKLHEQCNSKIATLEKWQKFGYITDDKHNEFLQILVLNAQNKLRALTKESTAGPAAPSPRKDS